VNLISSIFIIVAILGVSLVVNGTFNHKYDLSRISIQQQQQQQPINVTDIQNLNGNIISLHKNDTSNPAWIVSGKWKLDQIPNNDANNTNNPNMKNINFNASIVMESVDGINSHRHRITDFKLSNMTFHNRDVMIDGTVSLTTQGREQTLDKNIPNIPVKIKIFNLQTIIIEMENKMAKEHFGGSPIYGKVD
jgi:hypothetical protein